MSIYILNGSRISVGSFLVTLSSMEVTDLGAHSIKNTLSRTGITAEQIDEVFMGHVVQAGSGQAPCRQAVIKAGLPKSIPCTTINKVCGSGMQSVISAIQSIKAGDNQICLAGGMESMSKAPHLLPGTRGGIKYGDASLQDSLQVDGLWDVYNDQAMGVCAEKCVEKYSFSREELDEVCHRVISKKSKSTRR